MAVSAVDIALWDLKARLLGVPLADALPRFHDAVPIYGSAESLNLAAAAVVCLYASARAQRAGLGEPATANPARREAPTPQGTR